LAECSQPNSAKWNIVDSKDGVIIDESGIQLKRCARQLRERTLSWWEVSSRGGICSTLSFPEGDLNILLNVIPACGEVLNRETRFLSPLSADWPCVGEGGGVAVTR
ncbi:unnamed protein product, partial [Owenia fusiformis]